MTQNRRFKKRVRARMAKTGESYSTAHRFFRKQTAENAHMSDIKYTTISNTEFGFGIEIPTDWKTLAPNLNKSPFGVARFQRDQDDLYEGNTLVFWGLGYSSATEAAEDNKRDLEERGRNCGNFIIQEVDLSGKTSTLLTYDVRLGEARNHNTWSVHNYFLMVRDTIVCLSFGTLNVDRDSKIFDHIAKSFQPIESPAGIVLVSDGKTPREFVVGLLERRFGYTRDKALQQFVKITTHVETVVALVPSDKAAIVVEEVLAAIEEAGYSLGCRLTTS